MHKGGIYQRHKQQLNVPNKVMDGLYIGNSYAASDVQTLKSYGITHILNAGFPLEQHAYFPLEFEYLVINLGDTHSQDLFASFAKSFEFIDRSRDCGGVLVHCFRGISRSAAIVCAYIMYKQRCSFSDALDIVSCARPTVLPNRGFMRQLDIFEKVLQNYSNEPNFIDNIVTNMHKITASGPGSSRPGSSDNNNGNNNNNHLLADSPPTDLSSSPRTDLSSFDSVSDETSSAMSDESFSDEDLSVTTHTNKHQTDASLIRV